MLCPTRLHPPDADQTQGPDQRHRAVSSAADHAHRDLATGSDDAWRRCQSQRRLRRTRLCDPHAGGKHQQGCQGSCHCGEPDGQSCGSLRRCPAVVIHACVTPPARCLPAPNRRHSIGLVCLCQPCAAIPTPLRSDFQTVGCRGLLPRSRPWRHRASQNRGGPVRPRAQSEPRRTGARRADGADQPSCRQQAAVPGPPSSDKNWRRGSSGETAATSLDEMFFKCLLTATQSPGSKRRPLSLPRATG